jgi:hypothetical protein
VQQVGQRPVRQTKGKLNVKTSRQYTHANMCKDNVPVTVSGSNLSFISYFVYNTNYVADAGAGVETLHVNPTAIAVVRSVAQVKLRVLLYLGWIIATVRYLARSLKTAAVFVSAVSGI